MARSESRIKATKTYESRSLKEVNTQGEKSLQGRKNIVAGQSVDLSFIASLNITRSSFHIDCMESCRERVLGYWLRLPDTLLNNIVVG